MPAKVLATVARRGDHSGVSLWLAIARAKEADDTVCARLGVLLEVAANLEESLAQAGISGMAGAVDAQRRIATVLAGVDAGRLAALRAAIAGLDRELREAAAALARLRAIKERLTAIK